MCASSLNDDKFAHPVIFGVFEGQFCDMSAKKLAILPWLMLTFYQYDSVVSRLDMYRTKVLMCHTMVLLVRPT
jgi:hypothetical protein